MSLINDLSKSQLDQIIRRLRALENAAPMNNAAIGRSGLLVYDGGVITIENGGLDVTGSAKISGTLDVTGTITQTGTSTFTGTTNLNGPTHITGDTDVTGKLDVTGPMATKGTLSVEGVTTLKNDLNVNAGKKVNLGSISLESGGATGGQINLVGGALSSSASFGTLLVSTVLEVGGTTELKLSAPILTITSLPTTTQKPNLYVDANGRLYRSTAV
ncbi:hypothetical protein [Specibacter sp. RAF43]|uniref:hypothetical protein n=1 Tax=Specibacter sp. RAF43 TaxID=3233057 RepID=UPI003F945098